MWRNRSSRGCVYVRGSGLGSTGRISWYIVRRLARSSSRHTGSSRVVNGLSSPGSLDLDGTIVREKGERW